MAWSEMSATRDMLDDHNEADLQWHGTILPSNGMQSTVNATMQIAVDARSISSVVPEPPHSGRPSGRKQRKKAKRSAQNSTSNTTAIVSTSAPANAKENRKELKRLTRAAALRKQYPTMRNIPKGITPSQRKKLILLHTQNSANMLQPNHSTAEGSGEVDPTPTTQSKESMKAANKEKQKNRATLLKQQYPGMEGVPSKIGRGVRKKLIAQYKAKSSAVAPSATMPTSLDARTDLPTRPVLPTSTSGMNPTYHIMRP